MRSQSDLFGLEVERALGAAAESPAPISLRQAVLGSVPDDRLEGAPEAPPTADEPEA